MNSGCGLCSGFALQECGSGLRLGRDLVGLERAGCREYDAGGDLGEVPISRMYHTLRTIHLLCGAFALPMLLIYGASAVQMAHTKWFSLTPVISESTVQLSSDYSDSRLLARELMTQGNVRGEINSVEETLSGFTMRI